MAVIRVTADRLEQVLSENPGTFATYDDRHGTATISGLTYIAPLGDEVAA